MVHNCSEYLMSTYYTLSSVISRTGKSERKRHEPCQTGLHSVLALEESTAIFICVDC